MIAAEPFGFVPRPRGKAILATPGCGPRRVVLPRAPDPGPIGGNRVYRGPMPVALCSTRRSDRPSSSGAMMET